MKPVYYLAVDIGASSGRHILASMDNGTMTIEEVYRFDMSPQTGSLGIGASYHPSMRQHQKMASELTAFLKKLMKW